MESNAYWDLFRSTGSPVAYMLYRAAEEDAFDPE